MDYSRFLKFVKGFFEKSRKNFSSPVSRYLGERGNGITLIEQEQMDAAANVPWEELVRRNREHLAKAKQI